VSQIFPVDALELTLVGGTPLSPVITGDVGDKKLFVRFDYGALSRLAGTADLSKVRPILAQKREIIRAAAANLLREGQCREEPDRIEVYVTALDL